MNNKTITLILGLSAILTGSAAQPSAAQSIPGDMAALEAAIAAASRSREVPLGSLITPAEEHDLWAPLSALDVLIGDLESLTPGRHGRGHLPPRSRMHVAAAIDHLGEARAAYAGTEPHLNRVFASIGAAFGELEQVREPQGQPFQSQLAAMSNRLADAARRIAADATAVAIAAETSSSVIAEIHLRRGDDAVTAGLYGVAVGAYADAFTAAGDGVVLDLDLLEDNIREALDGETVGYAYVIARDGILHARSEGIGGLARRSVDPPETPQAPSKEMYTASISKTISATALLKALHEAGISVDDAIGAYLPDDWEQGDDLELVTFRHLLTQTSGLDPTDMAGGGATPQTDASLQMIIAGGSNDTQRGNHNYRNANFSLMRIVIPRVVYGGLVDDLAAAWGPEAVHAGLYEYYVSENVLAPAGISQSQCEPAESPGSRTLLYPFPPENINGIDAGDWSFSCGATGWFLSALDLGAFLARLRFTNDILLPQSRALMDESFLGWLDPVAYATWVQGTWGIYRAHAGDFTNMTGCIMNFPSAANPEFPGVKVQVSLLINSTGGTLGGNLPISGPRRICKVLKAAYDKAWTAQ